MNLGPHQNKKPNGKQGCKVKWAGPNLTYRHQTQIDKNTHAPSTHINLINWSYFFFLKLLFIKKYDQTYSLGGGRLI